MERQIKIVIKLKNKPSKKISDGSIHTGNQRKGQHVNHGTYSSYVNKSGIYFIKNIKTDLYYIGSSKDIGSRLIKHFSQLRKGNHPNHLLLADYNKYGLTSFEFGVLEYTEHDLSNKERDYQNKFTLNKLYNLQIKDTHRSDAQRVACKNSNKESHKTEEYRQKMRDIKSNRIGKYDRNTLQLIEIYPSTYEICKQFNYTRSVIMGCCNGSKKTAYGYVWHYLDDNNNIIPNGKTKHKVKKVKPFIKIII